MSRVSIAIFVTLFGLVMSGRLWAAVPPLTDEQAARLATARDGRDHQEEAFFALLENVRQWDGTVGDTPVRLQANIAQLVDDPDAFRGEVVRIAGRLEQRAALKGQYAGVEEWFVRIDSGEPVIVFVVDLEGGAERWQEGRHVEVFGRFYKRVDAVDRQGQLRQYAAFVGAWPLAIRPATTREMVQLWVVAVPVVALLAAFVLLLIFVRRQGRSGQQVRGPAVETGLLEVNTEGDLPDDPAEALAELRRRASSGE